MTLSPPEPATQATGAELLSRLDRLPLGRPHRKLRRLGGLGYLFDSFDGTLMGYAMAAIIALWQIEEGIAGWLLASVFIGYLIGALVAGVLADRIGRRVLMMIALAMFTVFSLLMATSQDPTQLFIWRMLGGIGLGAESVLVAPYLAEFIPARHRGTFLGRTVAFFGYGSVLAGVIAVPLLGLTAGTDWGWRLAGVISILPIVFLLFMRRGLPESPRFLISKGRIAEATAVIEKFEAESGIDSAQASAEVREELRADAAESEASAPTTAPAAPRRSVARQVGALFRNGLARRTIIVWLLWFTLTGAHYGFSSWMVNLLIASKGFSIGSSLVFVLLASVAQIPGYHLAAWLAGRFEKKWVIAGYIVAGCLSAFGVAVAPNSFLLLVAYAFLAFFTTGAAAAYYPYTTELYPTALRTTGFGFASASARVGAIVSPIIIGYAFAAVGFEAVFMGLVTILAVSATLLVVFGERTNGKSLEEIGEEAHA